MKKNHLIVIAGPTAIGKTALAVQLAKHYNTVVLSADSRQFYQELSIGTAKPTAEEMQGVTHHFINNLSITDDYNVGTYEKEVITLLTDFFKKHSVVILCGGSGLFIDAVCNGLDTFNDAKKDIRDDINKNYAAKGLAWLQGEVKKLDPVYYEQVDKMNPQRLIRALEVCIGTGKPYSSFRSGTKKERDFNIVKILLNTDREKLYDRINHRVDAMITAGLLDEVKSVITHKMHNSLNTVGYKEVIAFIEGKQNWNKTVELIKQNTRNYAKRQLTWFRKDEEYAMFEPTQLKEIEGFIESKMSI